MISKSESRHKYYLDMLVEALEEVDESRQDAVWIMKEGIWYRPNSLDREKLCDLIIVYPNYAVPMELKGSWHQRHKAFEQIRYGKRFIDEEIHKPVHYGKMVVYDEGKYDYLRREFSPVVTKSSLMSVLRENEQAPYNGVPYGK
jgi:hypothetical protein